MVTAESDDDVRLDREEALGTCVLLLIAGNITTTNFVTNAVRCFADEDLFDPVREGEYALPTVLEEVLRYRSPVQAMTRIATRDVTVAGAEIEAGERVIAWLG